MSRILNSLTKIGIGIALIGGATNSMLYNGSDFYDFLAFWARK